LNAPFIPGETVLPASAAERMVVEARGLTGFLDGAVGDPLPGWHACDRDNREVLQALHGALALEYPQAGQPLWAVRMWTNLVWQPVYLAVIAVHFSAVLPPISRMSQRREGSGINGYRIAGEPVGDLPLETMIDRAGAELRAMADGVLAEINTITKLKRVPAIRLLTDRMLGLMTLLQRQSPDLAPSTIRGFSDRWLAAMGLTGQGDLESLFLPDGREVLIIARKGCCLDYLIEPDVYCASCPKQPNRLRRERQRANALEIYGIE